MDFLEHFQFRNAWFLLLLVPWLAVLILRRGKGIQQGVFFPTTSKMQHLGKASRFSIWNLGVPLAWLALLFSIVALARPVWRSEKQQEAKEGIDMVIVLDLSLSMEIDDFGSTLNPMQRITAAKKVVSEFIELRKNDRIGLVAFAGRPISASPITMDHAWILSRLDEFQLFKKGQHGTIEEQGTAIGSAIATAALRLDTKSTKSKVMILITDGASNSGKIPPIVAAEQAKTLGIKIYTIAIGTEEGRVSSQIQRFAKQEFDLPTLKKIAQMTGGEHYWAQNLASLENTFQTINRLEKTELPPPAYFDDTEYFHSLLIAAFVCLLGALFLLLKHTPIRMNSPTHEG